MADETANAWQDLVISDEALSAHCGLEISDAFIGGIWLGAIRRTCWQSLQGKLMVLGTEAMVMILLVMFSLPVGMAATRSPAGVSVDNPTNLHQTQQFWGSIGISACLLYGGRWLWRSRQQRMLQRLQKLLEEVVQFNRVAAALQVMQELQQLELQPANALQATALVTILQTTRENLIASLKLDQHLRKHQQQGLHHPDLLVRLATQVAHLQALQQDSPAQIHTSGYSQVLSQLIEISQSLQAELF